jgi:hypothetical protein
VSLLDARRALHRVFEKMIWIALAPDRLIDNSVRDGFLDDVWQLTPTKRPASAIERFAHDACCFGIECGVLEKGKGRCHGGTPYPHFSGRSATGRSVSDASTALAAGDGDSMD